MPKLKVDASEWIVVVHRTTYAVIRRVTIAGDENYWRVVSGEEDRSRRHLVGYWRSLEEASHNALAYVERVLPSAWMATGTATSHAPRAMTPQKPLPEHPEDEPASRAWQPILRGVDATREGPHRESGARR